MIKSALIALDGSKSSEAATELAIRVAKQHGAQLCGIGVLDVPTITGPEPTGAMGTAFKEDKDQALLADADKRVKRSLETFENRCSQAGVRCSCLHVEGNPADQIEKQSFQHDMIMIGKDSNFYFATSDHTGETVKRLLRDTPRPVGVVPDKLPEGGNIMMAYDGSLQSSRALHMFMLLGLARDEEVDLVSIHTDASAAKNLCGQAEQFLTARGMKVRSHPIASKVRPREILLAEVQSLGVRAVAMGAFGLGGLRAVFLGRSTREMLRRCPVPVFVYH